MHKIPSQLEIEEEYVQEFCPADLAKSISNLHCITTLVGVGGAVSVASVALPGKAIRVSSKESIKYPPSPPSERILCIVPSVGNKSNVCLLRDHRRCEGLVWVGVENIDKSPTINVNKL